jgi:hypothetical protein
MGAGAAARRDGRDADAGMSVFPFDRSPLGACTTGTTEGGVDFERHANRRGRSNSNSSSARMLRTSLVSRNMRTMTPAATPSAARTITSTAEPPSSAEAGGAFRGVSVRLGSGRGPWRRGVSAAGEFCSRGYSDHSCSTPLGGGGAVCERAVPGAARSTPEASATKTADRYRGIKAASEELRFRRAYRSLPEPTNATHPDRLPSRKSADESAAHWGLALGGSASI